LFNGNNKIINRKKKEEEDDDDDDDDDGQQGGGWIQLLISPLNIFLSFSQFPCFFLFNLCVHFLWLDD